MGSSGRQGRRVGASERRVLGASCLASPSDGCAICNVAMRAPGDRGAPWPRWGRASPREGRARPGRAVRAGPVAGAVRNRFPVPPVETMSREGLSAACHHQRQQTGGRAPAGVQAGPRNGADGQTEGGRLGVVLQTPTAGRSVTGLCRAPAGGGAGHPTQRGGRSLSDARLRGVVAVGPTWPRTEAGSGRTGRHGRFRKISPVASAARAPGGEDPDRPRRVPAPGIAKVPAERTETVAGRQPRFRTRRSRLDRPVPAARRIQKTCMVRARWSEGLRTSPVFA